MMENEDKQIIFFYPSVPFLHALFASVIEKAIVPIL